MDERVIREYADGLTVLKGREMKLLIIGNANSLFIKEYIANVLLPDNIVMIISYQNEVFKKYYFEKNIKVFEINSICNKHGGILSEGIIRKRIRKHFEKEKYEFDIVHIHYFDRKLFRICYPLCEKAEKRVLSFWGSDLNNTRWQRLILYKSFLSKFDKITVISEDMRCLFAKIYGKRLYEKVEALDFGNSLFGEIDAYRKLKSRDECKKYWNLPSDRIAVAVGYNGNVEQQHDKLIQSLAQLSLEQRKRICVVLHFAYGTHNEAYLCELIKMLESSNIKYLIISRFLNKSEVALLRLSIDIFLYGQKTDAFSASLQEYLYSGAIVIKPNWLKYEVLEENKLNYIEYESFEELPNAVTLVLNDSEKYKDDGYNRDVLKRVKSWQTLKVKWLDLYRKNV